VNRPSIEQIREQAGVIADRIDRFMASNPDMEELRRAAEIGLLYFVAMGEGDQAPSADGAVPLYQVLSAVAEYNAEYDSSLGWGMLVERLPNVSRGDLMRAVAAAGKKGMLERDDTTAPEVMAYWITDVGGDYLESARPHETQAAQAVHCVEGYAS